MASRGTKSVDKKKSISAPGKKGRRTNHRGPNRQKQAKYIEEYVRNLGIKAHAAKAAGITISTVWRWENEDEEFCQKLKEATTAWDDAMMAAAMKRAIQKSDTLMIFFLKSRFPERFDDAIRKMHYERKQFEETSGSFELPTLIPFEVLPKADEDEHAGFNGQAPVVDE